MKTSISRLSLLASLALGAFGLAGVPANAAEGEPRFTDPIAYCKAVGAIDAPDARYQGPLVPAWMVSALYTPEEIKAQGNAGIDPARAVVWRCLAGEVFACVQANSPICGKANQNRTPTTAMREFCAGQPNADVIPLSVIGHENPMIYEWTCKGRTPAITRQIFSVDARGFPIELWKEIAPTQE